jgi:large subunit ribosomal protein L10
MRQLFNFMALTKEQKQRQIKDLKEKISKQKSVVFVDFSKISSKDMFGLRKKLKEAGCLLKIGKKTLIRIAFGQLNISFWQKIKKSVPGQLALVFGIEDEVAPAKISYQFSKEHENFKILGGIFENKFIDKTKVLEFANLLSKDELLAKLVGSIARPMSDFVNVLQGNIKGLITVLSKIKK